MKVVENGLKWLKIVQNGWKQFNTVENIQAMAWTPCFLLLFYYYNFLLKKLKVYFVTPHYITPHYILLLTKTAIQVLGNHLLGFLWPPLLCNQLWSFGGTLILLIFYFTFYHLIAKTLFLMGILWEHCKNNFWITLSNEIVMVLPIKVF